MATLEVLPLILVFVLLFAYTLGSFGVIHTGIMHSISARTYAFETFRNRTNLWYFRDQAGRERVVYRDHGNRFHGIMPEGNREGRWQATERALRMGMPIESDGSRSDLALHNERVHTVADGKRNQTVGVSPIWITVQYGICMNVTCGGGE